MSAELGKVKPADITGPDGRRVAAQEVVVGVLERYLKLFHNFSLELDPKMPTRGPYLAITSHFSMLDVVALMVADPYRPRTTLVVKQEMMGKPLIGGLLRLWSAVSVERGGHDVAAVRNIWEIFKAGRGICIAGQGTRSRTGRLGPMDESLVNLALHCAKREIPIIPIVEIGTDLALPAGSLMPKPYPIKVRTGRLLDLSGVTDRTQAATIIQGSLAVLLPRRNRPIPDERVLWKSHEYVPKR